MEQQPPASPLFAGTHRIAEPAEKQPSHPVDQPVRKKRRWIWIVLLVLFALAFFLILRHKPAASTEVHGRHRGDAPVTLNAATAHPGDMAVKLMAIGTVTPTYTASITSQVTGQIIAVHYKEGQSVRKGQPLIDIDPRPYKAALDTALGLLQRDKGLLAQAQMDLERYQAAWARNAIAKQTLDDQAKLVEQDQGLVQSDNGTVETDQVNLAYCHIVSPINGRVGLRLVDPGNIVQAAGTTTLVVIAEVQPITVVFTIPEDSLPQVQDAMRQRTLQVTALDRTQVRTLAEGHLQTIDNQIDTTTGTVKLRATFDNARLSLFPNQFVNTQLLVNVLHGQVLVPNAAIQRKGTQAFVYLLQNGGAKITNITIAAADANNSAVTGLQAGDQVATTSFEKLQDKSKVRIVQQKLAASDSVESQTP
ncbi:efflux RND transporter periplasmic adaptor subunit [Acidipila sp. EB88]|uniref:efflux RND transporter periplasmic adaptor subunit n=1 Tax=Acidipila sp. EB88 TaxID=2305226 RepID=UPI000F5F234E|nr:efflux RND transporter periplasmic adaptor subunit [Acidipila sp. EB88]RRA48954.1 efflux RND transporter periplasmic adaptor subunit [Acidipila sp. EB88]